jgi:uncharacterized membrane protein YphA (DoxX/SURF4 family)
MFTSMLKPKVDLTSLVIRWGLAAVFLVHGYFKLVQELPLRPELMSMTEQTVIGWAEMIIGVAMMIGLLSRIAALAGIAHQVAIINMVTGRLALAGFEMTPWGADYTRVGPEFNLVIIALFLGVILLGSGVFSLDGLVLRLLSRSKHEALPPAPVLARTQ